MSSGPDRTLALSVLSIAVNVTGASRDTSCPGKRRQCPACRLLGGPFAFPVGAGPLAAGAAPAQPVTVRVRSPLWEAALPGDGVGEPGPRSWTALLVTLLQSHPQAGLHVTGENRFLFAQSNGIEFSASSAGLPSLMHNHHLKNDPRNTFTNGSGQTTDEELLD